MLISFRTQSKQTDSYLARRLTSQPEREAAGEAEKEGLLVVAVMLSVLCTAIVHESLLEAKSVRTEQGFPRDPSLSAGMPRRKISPGGERIDQRTPDMFTALSSQGCSERLDKLLSNLSEITAQVLVFLLHSKERASLYPCTTQ